MSVIDVIIAKKLCGSGGGGGSNPFVSIEDFVVAVSSTNTQAVAEYFSSVIAEQTDPTSHIVVAFITKEKPTTNSVNNAFVSMIYAVQNNAWTRLSNVLRWRDNAYQDTPISGVHDCILNAGDELYKITINARGVPMDEITVVDGTMTILALANTPTQNSTTLMIA